MDTYTKSTGIPEGTRDLIFDETLYRRRLLDSFRTVYESLGYSEIVTPTLEYYELFDTEHKMLPPESMYKLIDSSSKIMVLRPDNTAPIARVVSSKLRTAALPLNIYYSQQVYRTNDDYSGRRCEQLQSGIEIIGASGAKSNVACIATALEILKSTGFKYKLEIGTIAFYNAIIDSLNLTSDDEEVIRKSIARNNMVSLGFLSSRLSADAFRVIQSLPQLFGGEEVFVRASAIAGNTPNAMDALNEVKDIYDSLCQAGYKENIIVDFGIVHEIDYYTGCVFRGYVDGVGEHVLSGGRYDKFLANYGFDCPATGFAVNVDLMADALKSLDGQAKKTPVYAIIHYDNLSDFKRAEQLHGELAAQGMSCVYSCFDCIEQTKLYARKQSIAMVYQVSGSEVTKCSD